MSRTSIALIGMALLFVQSVTSAQGAVGTALPTNSHAASAPGAATSVQAPLAPGAAAAVAARPPDASAAGTASSPPMAHLPLQRDTSGPMRAIWTELLVGAAVLAALYALLQYVRRRQGAVVWHGRPSTPPRDSVTAKQVARLAPGVALHVVQWGGDEYLVALGPGGLSVVGKRGIPSDLPATSNTAPP